VSSKGKRSQILKDIRAELSTSEGIYMRPMLVDQVSYLLNMLNQADQKPGKDAYARYEELNMLFLKLSDKYSTLK